MKFLPHGEMLAEETSLDRVRLRDQDNVVKDYWKDFEFEPKGTCNRSQIALELVPYKTRIYVETPPKILANHRVKQANLYCYCRFENFTLKRSNLQ